MQIPILVPVLVFVALVVLLVFGRGRRRFGGAPPPPAPAGPPLPDVSSRLRGQLARVQELAAHGPGARAQIDQVIAQVRADREAIPAENLRLRRMTELVIDEMCDLRDQQS
jgi:hypothetical protein